MLYVFHFVPLMTFPPEHLEGCGHGVLPAGAQGSNDCVLACQGDSTEICGGANALVVYQDP